MVPSGQFLHSIKPSSSWYRPDGHTLQSDFVFATKRSPNSPLVPATGIIFLYVTGYQYPTIPSHTTFCSSTMTSTSLYTLLPLPFSIQVYVPPQVTPVAALL